MMLRVFSIFDSKAEAYCSPFFLSERGQAVRAFSTALLDPATEFHKWPADYTLFEIGAFDSATGVLSATQIQVPLGNGLTLLAQAGKADLERRFGADELRKRLEDAAHADAENSSMSDPDLHELRSRKGGVSG